MTDVKELVKALREEADWCKAIEWEIPICTEDHIREAADLIEQLSSKCRQLEMELHAAVVDIEKMIDGESFLANYVFTRKKIATNSKNVNGNGGA